MWPTTFREAWCAGYGIADEKYPRHFVRHCISRRALCLYPFLRVFSPDYFRLDLEAAEHIGASRTWGQLEAELKAFASNNRLRGGVLRNWLGIRLSGQRVANAACRMFGRVRHAPRQPALEF